MATRERQRRFEIVPMKAADLDDIMDIERVSFRAPWSRQVFVEELDRDWAHVDVLKERRADGPGAGVRQLLAGARRGARAQRRHPSRSRVGRGTPRACSST